MFHQTGFVLARLDDMKMIIRFGLDKDLIVSEQSFTPIPEELIAFGEWLKVCGQAMLQELGED